MKRYLLPAFLFLLSTSALAQTDMCTAAGGTRGPNAFTNNGTFGTLSGTPSTNPPTLGPALPTGITSYLYVNYVTRTSPYPGSPEDGEYNITNSTAYRTDGAWHVITDHGGTNLSTSSGNPSGQFMMINASFTAGVFYQQTLTIPTNTNFEYSIWLMNVIANNAPILPNVDLEIDRATVDDDNDGTTDEPGEAQVVILTGDIPNSNTPTWRNYGGIINSGASTQVTVRFRNNAPGGGGNDIALDDLNFTTCNGLPTGNVSGKLYWDANNNGSFDGPDTGLVANIGVELVNPVTGLIVATSQTNASGDYSFVNVPAGTYTIRVQSTDPELNGATPRTPNPAVRTGVSVTIGGTVNNQNFGYLIPRIAASKTASVSTTSPGSTYTYTITIPNTGNANATGSTFTDPLPTGVNYVTNSAALNGTNLGAASYPFGTAYAINTPGEASGILNAGETATITFQVTVNSSAGSTISNQGTVAYVGGPPGSLLTDDPNVAGTANPTVTPVIFPNVSASKVASVASTTPGSTYTYTITIPNTGSAATIGATFTDVLPAGLTYVAGSATLNGSNMGAASYPFATARAINTPGEASGVLNPGETATITFQVRVNDTGTLPSNPISNQGTVNYAGGNPILTDDPAVAGSANPTNTPITFPNLSVTKSHAGNFNFNSSDTYTIVVSNATGAATTSGTVTVTDSLRLSSADGTVPAGITITGMSGTGWTCGTGSTSRSCTRSDPLPAGSSYPAITVTVALNTAPAATFTNRAVVSGGGESSSTLSNNTADDNTTVVFPNLTVFKEHAGDFPKNTNPAGVYTIVVSNAVGAAPTAGTVTVTDTDSSANVTVVAISGTGWSCTLSTATCTRSDSLAGGSSYPPISVSVATNSSGGSSYSFNNTATVSGGGDSTPHSFVDPTTVFTPDNSVDLSVAKTDGLTSAIPGQSVSYTITVTKLATSAYAPALPSISLVDVVPPILTGLVFTPSVGLYNSSTGIWSGLSLGQGQSITLTVSGTINPAARGNLVNSVTVAPLAIGTTDLLDNNLSNNTATDTDSLTPRVNLTISKTDGQTTDVPGTSVSYTIQITNGGPSTLLNGTVSDVVDTTRLTGITWTCVAVGGANCTASGSGNISDVVDLPPTTTAPTAKITYTLNATILASASGTLSNTVGVTMPADTINTGATSATDNSTLTPESDVEMVSKTVDNSTPLQNTNVVFTLTVRNNGASDTSGVQVTDALPAGLTFVSSSSASYNSATGVWNVGTLTVGSTATLQITATATAAGSITNTATKTAQSGTDTNTTNNAKSVTLTVTAVGVSVSGRVYQDLQPNSDPDSGEDWAAGTTVRVNLVQGSTVIQTATVNAGTGTFSFSTVAAGNYSLIVTTSATSISPTAPTGWIFIEPNNGSISLSVASSNILNQNFGLYQGSRLSGRVFRDDGLSSGTANDAVQNGGELGIAGVTLTASDETLSRTAVTNATGDYLMYLPASFGVGLTLSHTQQPASGTNIAGASVVLATAFNNINAQRHSITFAAGQNYAGYNFGVVWPSRFRPDQSGTTTSPGVVAYAHLLRPGTLGTLTVSLVSGPYTYQLRRDVNCDGDFADTGEAFAALPQAITVDATWPREPDGSLRECPVEILVIAPGGLTAGTLSIAQFNAALVWLSNPVVSDVRSVSDTTRIIVGGQLELNKQVRNVTQGSAFATSNQAKPTEVLEYRIAYRNTGTQPVFQVILADPVPFFTDIVENIYGGTGEIELTCPDNSVVQPNLGAVALLTLDLAALCNLNTASNPAGGGNIEALLAGEQGFFVYRVRVR